MKEFSNTVPVECNYSAHPQRSLRLCGKVLFDNTQTPVNGFLTEPQRTLRMRRELTKAHGHLGRT